MLIERNHFVTRVLMVAMMTGCGTDTLKGLNAPPVDPAASEETPAEGGSAATSNEGGGGAAPVAQCDYPAGPYGFDVGQTVPQAIQFDGFLEHSADPTQIPMTEYLDCTGTRGTNALLVILGQTDCEICKQEASTLNNRMKNRWEAMGIRVLTLMVSDLNDLPGSVQTAKNWKDVYKLDSTAVAADPSYYFAPQGSFGTPYRVVVDPRTMQITSVAAQDEQVTYTELEAVATRNASPQ